MSHQTRGLAWSGPARFDARVAVVVLMGCVASSAWGQGGGNANAVGQSIQNAAQSASGSPGSPSGSPGSPSSDSSGYGSPPMSSPVGSGSPTSSSGYGSPDGSSYGESGSGYGAGAGTSLAQRGQVAMAEAVKQVSTSLASFFAVKKGSAPPISSQPTLWEQAAMAFYQGDQKRALALYHAHIVADGDTAQGARAAASYSRLLKRPTWAVRYGISIHVRAPGELAADPQPIREGMQLSVPGGRSRGGQFAGGQPGNSGMSEMRSGEFAPASSPDGSPMGSEGGQRPDMIAGAAGSSMDSRMSSDGSGGYGAAPAKPPVATFGGAGMIEANKTLDVNLGIVADILKSMFAVRQTAGKFGRAFEGMESAGEVLMQRSADSSVGSPALPMWAPGIDFVGSGPVNDMLVIAKENEIDLLLHFDVIAKENRAGSPPYTTRGKLLFVSTGETLGVSKAIDKFEVATKRTPLRESVEELLVNLFEIIDAKTTVEPIPALQATHALTRIDALLGTQASGSMRMLAELAMFQSRNLITREQLDEAIFYAAGEEGLKMLHDEELSRYETINNMIERELSPAAAEE